MLNRRGRLHVFLGASALLLVEVNPCNPTEIIGDLAKRWEVTEGG
jgi:hypothetical protein